MAVAPCNEDSTMPDGFFRVTSKVSPRAVRPGYFLMQRGWMDNPAFLGRREPFCRRAAYAWLVEMAAYKDTIQDVNGAPQTVLRGQVSVSLRQLCDTWMWSLNVVRRFIDRLKTDTLVVVEVGTGRMMITICNYDKFQTPTRNEGTARNRNKHIGRAQDGYSTGTQKNKGNESNEVKQESLAGVLHQPLSENDEIRRLAEFDQFWAIYPRKVGKGDARKAFLRALRNGANAGELIRAVKAQQFSRDPHFRAHPTTWLNSERWHDNPKDVAPDPKGGPKPDPNRDWMSSYIEPAFLEMASRGEDAFQAEDGATIEGFAEEPQE
jgi:hypothetical protein